VVILKRRFITNKLVKSFAMTPRLATTATRKSDVNEAALPARYSSRIALALV
jgi:hypothetical protein